MIKAVDHPADSLLNLSLVDQKAILADSAAIRQWRFGLPTDVLQSRCRNTPPVSVAGVEWHWAFTRRPARQSDDAPTAALQRGPTSFGIFDVFGSAADRELHPSRKAVKRHSFEAGVTTGSIIGALEG